MYLLCPIYFLSTLLSFTFSQITRTNLGLQAPSFFTPTSQVSRVSDRWYFSLQACMMLLSANMYFLEWSLLHQGWWNAQPVTRRRRSIVEWLGCLVRKNFELNDGAGTSVRLPQMENACCFARISHRGNPPSLHAFTRHPSNFSLRPLYLGEAKWAPAKKEERITLSSPALTPQSREKS